jgi:hypothetical protein
MTQKFGANQKTHETRIKFPKKKNKTLMQTLNFVDARAKKNMHENEKLICKKLPFGGEEEKPQNKLDPNRLRFREDRRKKSLNC